MGSTNDNKKKAPTVRIPTALEIKTMLMAAQGKINLYRQRKVNTINARRKEIVNCLRSGNIEIAKAKMETIIREEDTISVFDGITPTVEILKEKVTYIMSSTVCPPDLHRYLDTLIYASTRLEVEELHKIKELIRMKYGDTYIVNCETDQLKTVNPNIVAKLSVNIIPNALLIVRLKQIAKEFRINCNFDAYEEDMSMQNSYGGQPGPYGPGGQNPGFDNSYSNPYDNINMSQMSRQGGPNQMNNYPNPQIQPFNQPPQNNPYGGFGGDKPGNNPYGGFGGDNQYGGFDAHKFNNPNYGDQPQNPAPPNNLGGDFPGVPSGNNFENKNDYNSNDINHGGNDNFNPYASNFGQDNQPKGPSDNNNPYANDFPDVGGYDKFSSFPNPGSDDNNNNNNDFGNFK